MLDFGIPLVVVVASFVSTVTIWLMAKADHDKSLTLNSPTHNKQCMIQPTTAHDNQAR